MIKRIFLALFLVSITLMSFSLVSSADTSGKIQINTGGGSIGSCDEQWGCFCDEDSGKYVCFQTNPLCDSDNLRPEIDGTSCIPDNGDSSSSSSSSSGSSGGGGSSSSSSSSGQGVASLSVTQEECVEDWECGAWSNLEESCGTRSCTDLNACGTTQLKPLTFKACESSLGQDLGGGITGFITAVGDVVGSGTGLAIILIVLIVVLFVLANAASKRKAPSVEKINEVLEQ